MIANKQKQTVNSALFPLISQFSKRQSPILGKKRSSKLPKGQPSNPSGSIISNTTSYVPVHSFSDPHINLAFGQTQKELLKNEENTKDHQERNHQFYKSQIVQENQLYNERKSTHHKLKKTKSSVIQLYSSDSLDEAIIAQTLMPREPTLMICPFCNCRDYTEVDFQYGGGTCFASVISGVLCFPFGFFIPYFISTFKDAVHFCPKCQKQVGLNKPC